MAGFALNIGKTGLQSFQMNNILLFLTTHLPDAVTQSQEKYVAYRSLRYDMAGIQYYLYAA